jgi:hypothetical protein
MPLQYPRVNGTTFDFSCIEANANGMVCKDYEEISYSDDCEPGEARGTHQQALATTPGEYKAEGSLTMYKDAFDDWVAELGDGYMVRSFPITVTYGNDFTPLTTDTLHGCRIKKVENQHQKGNEPLKVKVDLYVAQIDHNGVKPIPNALY